MSQFESVAVTKAANVYYDGNVTSRTITFADGSTKTLGIMLPGRYEFSTGKAELMEITQGKLNYQLAGSEDWVRVTAGEHFHVPANSSFTIKIEEVTDYICSFLDENPS